MAKDASDSTVTGEFIDIEGERFYAIRRVDLMEPFFVSVISNDDHWLFISSTGGLTAGRVSPDTALFPYTTVDKIHTSTTHTGSTTMLRVQIDGKTHAWEPFNSERDGCHVISRNLYKNLLGNKLRFEEINHDLQIVFRYTWVTSDRYGFARQCELENLGDREIRAEIVDGLRNILPAGTPRFAQTNTSNLVDAYKWTELDTATGLAMFALFSGISDRAEPCESLNANTAFCLGLDGAEVLVSSTQLAGFRRGEQLRQEVHKRGVRGAYLLSLPLELAPGVSRNWQIVANVEQSQSEVVRLRNELRNPDRVTEEIAASIDRGSDELARIMAAGDGFQATGQENVAAHHYANALFNILRGGIFDDQYNVPARDFADTLRSFNRGVYQRHRDMLDALPEKLEFAELAARLSERGDLQLERLAQEYLPITFGRRHGDPSRPWNEFEIRLKDDDGKGLLSYQGNWRDIFQNWEAMLLSFPEFVENVIAKFVNASTADGYNPYRITKEGIDWEVEEPDNPWSYIGYWGDHQIIYLQKLLELSERFHPEKLGELLHRPVFCYANVPYRIRSFDALLDDPKNTVDYDEDVAAEIERRVERMGADGKLLLDADGEVYQVNLVEKLLVPLLAKLGNLVIDGGIWLNTQRPEWNDANNALVGQGLSMVTLYYMRRYVRFLQKLFAGQPDTIELSGEVSRWLAETSETLGKARPLFGNGPASPATRFELLDRLGRAASRYRDAVYATEPFSGKVGQPMDQVMTLLTDALAAIDHCIAGNRREDDLYHAYNLLHVDEKAIEIDTLYPMLEGQVAALSAGAIGPEETIRVLEALFRSEVYRPDQHSFMLYPDRALPDFLEKNRVPAEKVEAIPLLTKLLDNSDGRIVVRDDEGSYRFNSDFRNVGDLDDELDLLEADYGKDVKDARGPLRQLYEHVFNHRAFTGRSGGMFGFEGLGCIYWHMVSKLLLAIEENFFLALDKGTDEAILNRLGQLYYDVRKGIGFNKTPAEYGAFPTDPYSHTPRHAGARQPGMTGQVKEELVARFGELGVRISEGAVRFRPRLLRAREFSPVPARFRYVDVDDRWQEIAVPPRGLAFTWCQVPVIYVLDDDADPAVTLLFADDTTQSSAELALSATHSAELFRRSGHIRQIRVTLAPGMLLPD